MSAPEASGEGLVVVAHPDDEVLWAGGSILTQRSVGWTIVSLCRASDPDRNPRFFRAASRLGATGIMGDMDDGPEQRPLSGRVVEKVVDELVPRRTWDFVLTHSPYGEYTRHRRHEETGRAVAALWRHGRISAASLWLFAYEDGGRAYPPRAVETADHVFRMDQPTFNTKLELITGLYGFDPSGFEGRAASPVEGFWVFNTVGELDTWLKRGKDHHEDTAPV